MFKLSRNVLLVGFVSLWLPVFGFAEDRQAELFQQHLSRAQDGDVVSQFFVASWLDAGIGTPKDSDQAKHWYEKAAAQGHPLAKLKLEEREQNSSAAKQQADSEAAARARQQAETETARAKERAAARAKQEAQVREAARIKQLAAEAEEAKIREAAQAAAKAKARTAAQNAAKAKEAAPVVVAAITPRPMPIADTPPINALDVIMRGKWARDQQEVYFLPSSKSDCLPSGAELVCFSHELRQNLDNASVSYVVKSTLSQFGKDGSFNVNYIYNVTDVRKQSDAGRARTETPGLTATLGWQPPGMTLACKVVDDRKLSCTRDKKNYTHYTRL